MHTKIFRYLGAKDHDMYNFPLNVCVYRQRQKEEKCANREKKAKTESE